MIVRASEPINAIVCPTVNVRGLLTQPVYVAPIHLGLNLVLALIGRISDNDFNIWPIGEECISASDDGIKVVERKSVVTAEGHLLLRDFKSCGGFIKRKFYRQHERDT